MKQLCSMVFHNPIMLMLTGGVTISGGVATCSCPFGHVVWQERLRA